MVITQCNWVRFSDGHIYRIISMAIKCQIIKENHNNLDRYLRYLNRTGPVTRILYPSLFTGNVEVGATVRTDTF